MKKTGTENKQKELQTGKDANSEKDIAQIRNQMVGL